VLNPQLIREEQCGEGGGEEALCDLTELEDDAAAGAVRQDAAVDGEKEAGDGVGEFDPCEGREGTGDVVRQETACDLLHLQR
jgi:hypothetical protein